MVDPFFHETTKFYYSFLLFGFCNKFYRKRSRWAMIDRKRQEIGKLENGKMIFLPFNGKKIISICIVVVYNFQKDSAEPSITD